MLRFDNHIIIMILVIISNDGKKIRKLMRMIDYRETMIIYRFIYVSLSACSSVMFASSKRVHYPVSLTLETNQISINFWYTLMAQNSSSRVYPARYNIYIYFFFRVKYLRSIWKLGESVFQIHCP